MSDVFVELHSELFHESSKTANSDFAKRLSLRKGDHDAIDGEIGDCDCCFGDNASGKLDLLLQVSWS